MKIKGEFVLRELAGDYILVPIGPSALELNGMITLNEIGVYIWKKLESGCNYDQLLTDITDEYDVTHDVAKRDLDEFLLQLQQANIVE